MIPSSASDALLGAAYEGTHTIAIGREATLELRNLRGTAGVRTTAVGGAHLVQMRSPLALVAGGEAR